MKYYEVLEYEVQLHYFSRSDKSDENEPLARPASEHTERSVGLYPVEAELEHARDKR